MNQPDEFGPEGSPRNTFTAAGSFDPAEPFTELRLSSGEVLRVRTAVLMGELPSEGKRTERVSFEGGDPMRTEPVRRDESGNTVIPLAEERLDVSKRVVATGVVRLQKTVQEYTETLDEPLAVRTFDIERVILNQPVETAPGIRHEGATTIYPLVEEQLILTKHLVLKEEVRVTQRDTERRDTQTVTLRREHLNVEREPLG